MPLGALWSSLLSCPGCGWRAAGPQGCCPACWRRLLRLSSQERLRRPDDPMGPASLGPYRGLLGRLLRAAKYRPSEPLLRSLGLLLHERLHLPHDGAGWWVVPVPPDERRRRQRIDHAHVLAAALAATGGQAAAGGGPRRGQASEARLLLLQDALRRTRATRPQAGLSAAARERNLLGAMAATAAGRRALPQAKVLLVDDVLTSGATLRACRAALVMAGAAEVRVAVVAVARG